MHTNDSSVSPRKRTVSRGISEDESLRNIIKETDSSSRRLTRSDSRPGTLRRRTESQQSDQDLVMGLSDMLELQASYDEAVQELRGLEVEREALLFQVDVLQDSLEGVEELLAEAQREARQANLELEQEKEDKKKLENMIQALMQEVKRLKEEMNEKPSGAEVQKDASERDSCSFTDQRGFPEEPAKEPEPAGHIPSPLRRMTGHSLGQLPSLALDTTSTDGVLQRPYEKQEGRDSSPDRNDSDKSAYEDASAETPEQEKLSLGNVELPNDSEHQVTGLSDGCPDNGSATQDHRNPEACVLS